MKIDHEMTLTHLNIRREKAGEDEGPIACDIKLTAQAKPETIRGLFSTEAAFRMLLLSRWNDEGELVVTDNSMIPLDVKGVGTTVEFKPAFGDSMRYTEADVDNIVLEVKAGKIVVLKMRVQVNPTKDQMAQLVEWHSASLDVSVWSRQHDLDFTEASESDDAAVVEGQRPPQRPRKAVAGVH